MSLTPSTRIGTYEIVAKLGEGGMGEVYRARDTKLGREVAIKVLPDALASDPDRVARFEREARTLAALNHPNIAHLHGFEESGTVRALVMELVEGPTLADRIASGALPIDEALPIARQMAEALEAAHEQGFIHRDLKPANIKVRDDGTVKVLDFGLAKALDPVGAAANLTMSPTLSVHGTFAGTILGTAAYMSPEQARGKAVDKRTDIWAFGCVLYEMLTGRQCFDPSGDSVSDAIAAILKNEPDWTALPAETPTHIRTLLRRCLQKDLQRRLPHIGIARLEISEPPPEQAAAAVAPPAQPGVASPSRSSRRTVVLAWSVAMVGMVAAATLGVMAYRASRPSVERIIRFSVAPPDGWRLQNALTTEGGPPSPLAVSPDGSKVAMVLVNTQGKIAIWIRALDSVSAQMLAGTDGAMAPFWSPDSRYIAFFAGGKLKKVEAAGGPPFVLCDSPQNRVGSWGKDGTIVFSSNSGGLLKVSDAGGVPQPATTPEKGEQQHTRPTFLADGRHFYYRVTNGGSFIGSLDGSDRTPLFKTQDASNVAFSRGHVLFLRGATLMAQPFDSEKLALTGEPVPIADQILTNGNPGGPVFSASVPVFSASDGGTLVYMTGASRATSGLRLAWFDRSGKQLTTLGAPGAYSDISLSRDGKRAVVGLPEPAANVDLWLFDIGRGIRSRFTFDPTDDIFPVFSPDGGRIAFSSRRKEHIDLYIKATNGAGAEELLLADDSDKRVFSWSPDGRYIVYAALDSNSKQDLWVLPLLGGEKPFPFTRTAFNEIPASFSPDGRWIAYVSDESGVKQVYVAPFPGPGGKWQVSTASGDQMRWNPNGKEIFYNSSDGTMTAVSVSTRGSSFEVGQAVPLFKTSFAGTRWQFDVSPDGQRFLINGSVNDATSTATSSSFNVVVNWSAALKK